MASSAQDVAMGESKSEDMETSSRVRTSVGFSTPTRRRRQASGFEFSVTPEPRRRTSTPKGQQPDRELQESPARYSPSKVKAAVRSFADFLHFLEQEEHHQEHELMPVIIQRFAELGAVIESQKRHIDRWKGKELDLAIEEAQQNLELIRELGETIQKQEVQIASIQVEKQSWEEKYHLAAQEVESLKKQGTYQIQQLNSEVSLLRQAGADLETKLKERDGAIDTLQKTNEALRSQLEQMDLDSAKILRDNTSLKQQCTRLAEEKHAFEQQILELREHCEFESGRSAELEQAASSWQTKYEEMVHQTHELETALNQGKNAMGDRESTVEHLMAENQKYQEHVEKLAQEHEQRLAEIHKHTSDLEADRRRLSESLQQEAKRYQDLKKQTSEMRALIEAEAMSAMTQREQQMLNEKAHSDEALNHELSRAKQENSEMRAKMDSLTQINQSKVAEVEQLMARCQELDQRQAQAVDAQRIQQLSGELDGAKQYIEKLSKDMAEKVAGYEEELKTQALEFETQYNDFVTQVEGQFNELNHENEQLRAALEESEKNLEAHSGQASADVESEMSKWRAECEKLEHHLHEGVRENDSLKRELEHRMQELELKTKEVADLNSQIEQFLSPNNDRTKEVELLHRERIRLEEQNQGLQRQIEVTRAEANAKMDEARQVHFQSVEQENAHRNAVQSLRAEKEDLNRNIMALASEKSAMEFQITSARNEINHWKMAAQQLEKEKQELDHKIQDLMRQATQQIETQKHAAAVASEDGRTQLQKLTAQLVQRDTQMNEGQQQLRNLQKTVRSLEENLRTKQHEVDGLQVKNEEMTILLASLHNEKRELEAVMQHHSSSLLRASQRDAREDLPQRLGRITQAMEQRVLEESEKANRLQAVLESRLDTQQQHLNDENRKLEVAKVELEQKVEELATECEKLDSELAAVHRERDEQEQALAEMHDSVASLQTALDEEKWARENATGKPNELDTAPNDFKMPYEQLKAEAAAQLKAKSDQVADLQDELAELQAKLDQEKQMTRHLMDRAHAEKQEHASSASEKATLLDGQRARVAELEASVRTLQHKLQVKEESVVGKEQSAMHEKLQKEREYRSLQTRYDTLVAENAATLNVLDHKVEEIKELRDEIGRLRDGAAREHGENPQMEREHRSLQARNDSLAAENVAMRQELIAKVDEIRQLHDEIDQLRHGVRQPTDRYEKPETDREYRLLQTQYDDLAAEHAVVRKELDNKAEEIEQLHDEIDQLHQEVLDQDYTHGKPPNDRKHRSQSRSDGLTTEGSAVRKAVAEKEEEIEHLHDEIDRLHLETQGQNGVRTTPTKEREHRSLPARYDDLAAENAAVRKELDEKVDEIEQLRDEIDQLRRKVQRQDAIQAKPHKEREHRSLQARYDDHATKNSTVQEMDEKEEEIELLRDEIDRLRHQVQEQGDMPAKSQTEREYRSLQTRYNDLNATHKEMENEVEQLHDEIDRLHHEIRDNTIEMDNARGHLHASEQLTMRLEELQEELEARDEEIHQRNVELAAKANELQQAREVRRRMESALEEKEDQLAALKQQLAASRERMKRVEQERDARSKRASAIEETSRTASKEEKEKSLQREQELNAQIVRLEEEKLSMLNQFRREMKKLNIEFGAQRSNGNIDESAFHRGIMELSALLRSYQDREARQDALIHRKEKQMDDLKSRVSELEKSIRTRSAGQHDGRHQHREEEESLQEQIVAMGKEISNLRLKNEDTIPTADGSDASAEVVREWEERCMKLKLRVRELREANAKLKDTRFSKADVKALVEEVEKLTSQVLEKDLQLQALRKHERPKFKSSSTSASGAGSRRSKDLLLVLQQKEDKIMVLNDHLTELMTQNMQLQHDTERYVIKYGPLSGTAAANGVIGNSGIRVPARTNGTPAVRSQ